MDSMLEGEGANDPLLHLRADFWKRMLWTVGLLAIIPAMWFVPLVGMNTEIVSRSIESASNANSHPVAGWIAKGTLLRSLSICTFGIVYLPFAMGLVLLASAATARIERRIEKAGGWSGVERWAERITLPLTLFMAPLVLNIFAQPGYTYLVPDQGWAAFYLPNLAAIVGAAAITLLVSRQISRRGLGVGTLTVLALNPASNFLVRVMTLPELIRAGIIGIESLISVVATLLLLAALALAVVFTVRRIPVLRARNTAGSGADPTSIELVPCPALIWPLLAAKAAVDFLPYLARPMGFTSAADALQTSGPARLVASLALTAVFGILGNRFAFDPYRISATLISASAFIQGVRPGRKTAEFLSERGRKLHFAGLGLLLGMGLTEGLAAYAWRRIVREPGAAPLPNLGVVAVATGLIVKASLEPGHGDPGWVPVWLCPKDPSPESGAILTEPPAEDFAPGPT